MKSARDEVIAALNMARLGDVGRGTRHLLKLRNRPGFEAEAYYGLGLIELCLNNMKNAEAYFKKAITIEPEHADSYYQLAKIADSRGDPLTAKLYFKSAIARKPGHVMAAAALAEHGAVWEHRNAS